MKNAFVLLLLVCVTGCLPKYSQSTTANLQGNTAAHLPKGKYAHRSTEGSGMEVPIDTLTALDTLIHRLNSKWELMQTGKAYWIGYTDDMYSIAAHGEAAIEPLMHFIKSSATPKGKYGVIYTLHLIGINSKSAGRFYEEFTSVRARAALRDLLLIEAYQDEVMELLKRDPWQSDIPYFFAALSHSKADNWPLVNGMTRYKISGMPVHEVIPQNLYSIVVNVPKLEFTTTSGLGQADTLDYLAGYNKQIKEVFADLQKAQHKGVIIEDTLFQSALWGNWATDLCINANLNKRMNDSGCQKPLGNFLGLVTEVDYYSNGSRIQYYLEGNKIHICSTITAKKRLLSWWSNQSIEVKNSFNQNSAAAK